MLPKILTKFQAKKCHIVCLKQSNFDVIRLNSSADFRNYSHTWLYLLIFSSWRSGRSDYRSCTSWIPVSRQIINRRKSHCIWEVNIAGDLFAFCTILLYNPLHLLLHLANQNAIKWPFNMSFFPPLFFFKLNLLSRVQIVGWEGKVREDEMLVPVKSVAKV